MAVPDAVLAGSLRRTADAAVAQSFRHQQPQSAGSDLHARAERAAAQARQRRRLANCYAAVVKQPAMLVWLDADSNRAGHANENLARELMELFTLGIGHFTEADVQARPRALTGWSVDGKAFRLVPARHDDDEMTVLGPSWPLSTAMSCLALLD